MEDRQNAWQNFSPHIHHSSIHEGHSLLTMWLKKLPLCLNKFDLSTCSSQGKRAWSFRECAARGVNLVYGVGKEFPKKVTFKLKLEGTVGSNLQIILIFKLPGWLQNRGWDLMDLMRSLLPSRWRKPITVQEFFSSTHATLHMDNSLELRSRREHLHPPRSGCGSASKLTRGSSLYPQSLESCGPETDIKDQYQRIRVCGGIKWEVGIDIYNKIDN